MKRILASTVILGTLAVNLLAFQNCGGPGLVARENFSTVSASAESDGNSTPSQPLQKACADSKVLGRWSTNPVDFFAPEAQILTFNEDCTITTRICNARAEFSSMRSERGAVSLKLLEADATTGCPPRGNFTCNYQLKDLTPTVGQLDINCQDVIKLTLFNGEPVVGSVPLPTATPPALATPKPAPSGPKRFFVTEKTYDGNLGGRPGADQKCQTDPAKPADLTTARAFIMYNGITAGHDDWPLYAGTTYTEINDLHSFETDMDEDLDLASETTPSGWPAKEFWFGAYLAFVAGKNCDDWTNASSANPVSFGGKGYLFFHSAPGASCATKKRLLCVEM